MKTFQLDENVCDKSLAKSCNESGLAIAKLQARQEKGLKDPQWVPMVLGRGDALITGDRRVIEDAEGNIPDTHPGIIIIENHESILHTFRTKDAKTILMGFKKAIPNWSADWNNSVIYLTQKSADIGHIQNGRFVRDEYLSMQDQNWRNRFVGIIESNHKRKNISPPSSGEQLDC